MNRSAPRAEPAEAAAARTPIKRFGDSAPTRPSLTRAAVIGAAVLAVLAGLLWWGAPRPPDGAPVAPGPVDQAAPAALVPETVAVEQDGPITVHVSGAVEAPGLVELPSGARIADAVAAAGGTLRAADLDLLNLAAPVADGEQVQVPSVGGGGDPTGAMAAAPTPGAGDGVVHVNTADMAELELLPGVGPVLAERILAHREQMGPFETVEDLLDVTGIGEGRLAALHDVVAIP